MTNLFLNTQRIQHIKERLTHALAPIKLEIIDESDLSADKQLEYLDDIYRELLKQGWKFNEIDDTDIYELLRLINKNENETKVEKKESMLEAFM